MTSECLYDQREFCIKNPSKKFKLIFLHLFFLFVQIENEQSRMEVIRANREQMDRKKANKEAEKKEVEDMLFYQGRV